MPYKIVRSRNIKNIDTSYKKQSYNSQDEIGSYYRNALHSAKDKDKHKTMIPIIADDKGLYTREEILRIAINEIGSFPDSNDMMIYLAVVDDKADHYGKSVHQELKFYLRRNYSDTDEKGFKELADKKTPSIETAGKEIADQGVNKAKKLLFNSSQESPRKERGLKFGSRLKKDSLSVSYSPVARKDEDVIMCSDSAAEMKEVLNEAATPFEFEHENKLAERMKHLSDTFSEYLLYLINDKNMENSEVYKRAIVDKKTFSKIKNNPDYHPQKITALCLCVGAKLNLDESKDLLARAGYALSPCDKTDIIFSYFIENEIYDMIELDIQLEEHGLPCIIS